MEDSKGLLVPGASRWETRTTRWHEQRTRRHAAGAAAACDSATWGNGEGTACVLNRGPGRE
jgi:hypothetical protein